jgi:hypothetical protein
LLWIVVYLPVSLAAAAVGGLARMLGWRP